MHGHWSPLHANIGYFSGSFPSVINDALCLTLYNLQEMPSQTEEAPTFNKHNSLPHTRSSSVNVDTARQLLICLANSTSTVCL